MFDTEKFIREIEAQPALYDVKMSEYSNRKMKAKCWSKVANAMFEDWGEIDVKSKDLRVKDLMKKWKAVRDNFVRDKNTHNPPGANNAPGTAQAAKRKRYIYYDQLLFLLPHVKGNLKPASNIGAPTFEEDDEEEMQVEVTHNLFGPNDEETASLGNSSPSMSANGSDIVQNVGFKRKSNNKVRTSKRMALERTILSSSKDLTNILVSSLARQNEERNSDKYGHKAFLLSFAPVLDSMSYNTSMQLRGQISQVFSNYFAQIEGDYLHRSNS